MPLPKALICLVGKATGDAEDANLRTAGFATATIRWQELSVLHFGWMQLAVILEDPSVYAWVMTGEPDDFIPGLLTQTTLLMLALRAQPTGSGLRDAKANLHGPPPGPPEPCAGLFSGRSLRRQTHARPLQTVINTAPTMPSEIPPGPTCRSLAGSRAVERRNLGWVHDRGTGCGGSRIWNRPARGEPTPDDPRPSDVRHPGRCGRNAIRGMRRQEPRFGGNGLLHPDARHSPRNFHRGIS